MEPIPTPNGLFETHLTVGDLAASVRFYQTVVGLEVAYEMPDRGCAFLWIGQPGAAMIGLWSAGTAPIGMTLHLAFRITVEELQRTPAALAAAGVAPLSFYGEPADEPSVIGWMPAASVYFRDPDGHMLEYLAMLPEQPRPDLGIVPWSEWRRLATQERSQPHLRS